MEGTDFRHGGRMQVVPLLYYWRGDNYRRDLDYGAGYHLNQATSRLHQIDLGDSLWAFTRAKCGSYALAAELIVRAKTRNPPGFRYGSYRIWGDLRWSRYFRVEDAPDIERVIRHLSRRIESEVLGRAFQGHAAVRLLTAEDHQVLRAAARDLPLEPRARLFPEELLEAALIHANPIAVADLLQAEAVGVTEQRRDYLYRQAPARNPRLVRELQEQYSGQCQLCGWDPRSGYGEFLCHGHHVHWLSRGGEDSLENLVLVCPNHHAAIHRADAPLDFADGAFVFRAHREPLLLNRHLPLITQLSCG